MSTTKLHPDAAIWLVHVDKIMERAYSIDSIDAGWNLNQVKKYFDTGYTPNEFVEWYGVKYGLIELDFSHQPLTRWRTQTSSIPS